MIGSDFVPPQLIKFELTDAKIPDFIQNAQHQRYQPSKSSQNSRPRHRKSRKGTTTEPSLDANKDASKSNESQDVSASSSSAAASSTKSSDQSGSDTRLLHIAHPGSFESQRYAKSLPFGIQKTISQAIKSDYNLPYIEGVKYYAVPRAKLSSVASLPVGAKLFSDSRIKQWWQLPPQYKASASTYGLGTKISASTIKPNVVVGSTPAPYGNDFVAYPLLRGYPVQYAMNVASDLVNGVSYLYGDRIYAKPYSTTSYQNKYKTQVNSLIGDIKPVVEPKPSGEVDDDNGIFRTTVAPTTSFFSTSPIVFPSSTELPKKQQTFFKYYAAEEPIPSNPDTGIPLSTDKTTIQLINKAVHELRKHNPHLNVMPKRVENDELVVHVTPKPDFFSTKYPATAKPVVSVSEAFKDLVTDKNLVYLNKVTELNGRGGVGSGGKDSKHTVAYVTHIELPGHLENLVCFHCKICFYSFSVIFTDFFYFRRIFYFQRFFVFSTNFLFTTIFSNFSLITIDFFAVFIFSTITVMHSAIECVIIILEPILVTHKSA